MKEDIKPWLTITPTVMGKVALSTVLISSGMYYLVSGRKEGNFSRMVTGAILSLVSLFIYAL